MSNTYKAFIFEDYEFDSKACEARFHYSFDGTLKLTETVRWQVTPTNYDEDTLQNALFMLWIMAGVSYFKAYLPKEIEIRHGGLNKHQKVFFENIYQQGLGEFFYTNQLSPKHVVNFPMDKKKGSKTPSQINISGKLLAIGGGKDSIVSAELLNSMGQPFTSWVVNHHGRFEELLKVIGQPSFSVVRTIDPKLIELNEAGAYNGHVPITAIISCIGVVLAVLTGKKEVVMSNEASANEANLVWKGLKVNHQFSKSFEFEKALADYLHQHVSPSIEYYSLLRPLSELSIAEVFCKQYFGKYKQLFSSCNANFKISKTQPLNWCGQCPKCAFVFTIFAPFLSKPELMNLFGGKDLFADPTLSGTFEQLLGIDGHKPLECVGEIAETRLAMQMTQQRGIYPEADRFRFPKVKYDYHKWSDNQLSNEMVNQLRNLIHDLQS